MQLDAHQSVRSVVFGGGVQRAEADYSGWQSFGQLETGLNLSRSKRLTLQPFIGLQHIYARQNGYGESGAGVLNLQVGGTDTHSLRTSLGSRLHINWQNFSQEIRGTWMHELLDTNTLVNAQFAAIGGSSFQSSGLGVGRDWAVLGTGLSRTLRNGLTVGID